jgi:phosphoribosylformimino-5-aminoimidazole carboxamide ribonucleotide (ProFAR) isomerase
MLVVPSIQLRGGEFVAPHPRAGNEDSLIGDPVAAATEWAAADYKRLQLVAAEGFALSNDIAIVDELVRNGGLEIQTSGDIRTTDDIERLADAGASSIVLGSRALDEPDWLSTVADLFPGVLVVASDVHERKVTMRGWVRNVRSDLLDLAAELDGVPLAGLLIRASHADSRWNSPSLALFEDLAERGGPPLFIETTNSNLGDLHALENRGVSAVILPETALRDALDVRAIAREFAS